MASTDFFGVTIDIPESWANRSAAVFVSPPRDDQPALPTICEQEKQAEMSIVCSAPEKATNISAADELRLRLDEMKQTIPKFQAQEIHRQIDTNRQIASAVCHLTDQFGMAVTQLHAVVLENQQCVLLTGSAPADIFDQAQAKLVQIIASVRLP